MSSPRKRFTIGIDIGGTKILVALLDERFRIQAENKTRTRPEKGERGFLETVRESVRAVLKESRVNRGAVAGLGAGCPGFVDPDRGIVADSPNIPFLRRYPLARRLSQATGLPAVIGNDVQTGLYGEHQFGAARGHGNVVGIFMGTGIGGALILNGRLYRGSTGSAGEVGHMLYQADGPLCGCGHFGCFEAFAGRLAISAEAAIAVARQQAPHLARKAGTDLRAIKSGALARAVQSGDQALEAILRAKSRIVGLMMANLVNLFNPDLIVLGGGLVEALPRLVSREAERAMRERALAPLARHVRVAVAQLGDHSIVMGAARRAADQFIDLRK